MHQRQTQLLKADSDPPIKSTQSVHYICSVLQVGPRLGQANGRLPLSPSLSLSFSLRVQMTPPSADVSNEIFKSLPTTGQRRSARRSRSPSLARRLQRRSRRSVNLSLIQSSVIGREMFLSAICRRAAQPNQQSLCRTERTPFWLSFPCDVAEETPPEGAEEEEEEAMAAAAAASASFSSGECSNSHNAIQVDVVSGISLPTTWQNAEGGGAAGGRSPFSPS